MFSVQQAIYIILQNLKKKKKIIQNLTATDEKWQISFFMYLEFGSSCKDNLREIVLYYTLKSQKFMQKDLS